MLARNFGRHARPVSWCNQAGANSRKAARIQIRARIRCLDTGYGAARTWPPTMRTRFRGV